MLWRARHWRKLLNLIDHLPRHSFYAQAVMNDPEHMEMLERVKKQGGTGPAPLPPLSTWSPEVDMMANVNDTLLLVKDAIVRSNVTKDKQKSIPDIKFTPRPGRPEKTSVTEQDRAEQQARHAKAVALFHPDAARREPDTDG